MRRNLLKISFNSKLFCLLSLFVGSFFFFQSLGRNPEEALNALLDSKSINKEQTSVYIWDLEGDYTVASHRAQYPITPASVMKCVTTAALKSVLPYTSRLTTSVYMQGNKPKGGVFRGRLIVEGAGDPSLNDNRHKGQEDFTAVIAKALKNKGITTFHGEIKVDESKFAGPSTPSSWLPADLSASYGTGFHAFNFEGNSSGKKAVNNPAAVFKKKLGDALNAEGIEFVEENLTEGGGAKQLLVSYSSPSLSNLMRSCMFRSDNLYAESFMRLFGLQNGTDGSVASSARVAMQHWDALNYPVDGIEIIDGSGLSRNNLLTAEFLGSVLKAMKDDPEYVSFFPLVGEEGTVKSFMKDTPLQGYMALKTGSMNGIQAYAGYVLDADYMPTHVVVVITNGMKNREAFRSALSSFFLEIFR